MMDMEQTLNNWKFIMACEEKKANADKLMKITAENHKFLYDLANYGETMNDTLTRLLAREIKKWKNKNAGK